MQKKEKTPKGQTGDAVSLPTPTVKDGALSLRHFFFARNVPLLELTLSLPLPSDGGKGAKRISAYYRRLAKTAISDAVSRLLPTLQRAYEADADPRKRFRHRPARLCLRGRITEKNERYFSAVWESRLFCDKQGEWVHLGAEIFTAKNGRLCPPAYLMYKGVPKAAPQEGAEGTPQSYAPKKRKKRSLQTGDERRKKVYFLENGALHLLSDRIRIF